MMPLGRFRLNQISCRDSLSLYEHLSLETKQGHLHVNDQIQCKCGTSATYTQKDPPWPRFPMINVVAGPARRNPFTYLQHHSNYSSNCRRLLRNWAKIWLHFEKSCICAKLQTSERVAGRGRVNIGSPNICAVSYSFRLHEKSMVFEYAFTPQYFHIEIEGPISDSLRLWPIHVWANSSPLY